MRSRVPFRWSLQSAPSFRPERADPSRIGVRLSVDPRYTTWSATRPASGRRPNDAPHAPPEPQTPPDPGRRRRGGDPRGFAASLPALLSTSAGRNLVLSRVNRAIAPGRISAGSLQFSWSGPIRARNLVLTSEAGKALVKAPSATWDRGLWRLLTDRHDLGTVTLQDAACDITRRDDGTTDLADSLGQKPGPRPARPTAATDRASRPTVVALKIVNGSLKLQSPELPHGLTAERFDFSLVQPAAPAEGEFQAA